MFEATKKIDIKPEGIALILSSPSGAGKSSISHALMERNGRCALSVSVTTRLPRPSEVDGQHYHFKTQEEFDQLVEEQAFLEWAKVFGHHYGTLRQPVEDALHDGRDIIFDIDWQGTQQLSQSIRPDIVSIFLLPPCLKVLENRLYKRAQDHEYVILDRMNKAIAEISHWPEYDHVLVNDDFETTVTQILTIMTAEKLRRRRQIGLEKFIKTLVE